MCVGLNAMIWLGAPIRINIIVFEKPGLCIKKHNYLNVNLFYV